MLSLLPEGIMAATLINHSIFLLIVWALTGHTCAAERTSVTTTDVHFERSLQGETYTSVCTFEVQDVELEIGQSENIILRVSGTVEENVTLSFYYHGDQILDPLPNMTLTPGEVSENYTLMLNTSGVGHTALVVNATPPNMTDTSKAFVRVSVAHSQGLDYFSDVVGWLYFVAWSISFYPQIYSNWKRKSVIGLHFDFLSLNTIGFFMYSVFNICLYWVPTIIQQYFQHHPYGVNPVQLNDVIFSVHAFIACIIQVVQCGIYERGDQRVSRTGEAILGGIGAVTVLMVVLTISAVFYWLTFLYFVSYVKLFITLIKYIPQAYYNYRRKSTSGWSIGNILLDFTGGILSIAQMFLLAYNYNDWGLIFGDPTKFGLGLFSVIFDVFFMVQHYILYRGTEGYRQDLSSPHLTQSSSLTESVASADYGATGIY